VQSDVRSLTELITQILFDLFRQVMGTSHGYLSVHPYMRLDSKIITDAAGT